MAEDQVFIGLDAGLTSTKAVVVDIRGRVLATAARSAVRVEGPSGQSERDLWGQWSACCAVLREALARSGAAADDVAGIGTTGHGDGLILVDDEGAPMRPGMLSLDTRSRELVGDLERDGTAETIASETGRPPASGRPVTLMLWMARNEPDCLAAARWLLFTKDWIKLRLTGRVSTDFSDASAGLLLRSRPEYAESVLVGLGLGAMIPRLPELIPSDMVAGIVSCEAAEETGLRAGTPVASGSHDSTASMIGTGALDAGTACLIAGTWSIDAMVSELAEMKAEASLKGVHSRWFLDGRRTLVLSSSPSGMNMLDGFRALAPAAASGEGDLMAGILGAAERSPEVAGTLPIIVPSFRGVGSSGRGGAAVVGLEGSHGPNDVGRSLAEAMAFRHRLGCELLGQEAPVSEVRVTGGLSRSDLWAQLLADVLGREVKRSVSAEAGAVGAAAMAGVAAGAWGSIEQAARVVGSDVQVFRPRQERKGQLDDRYAKYRSALEQLADVC